MKRRTPRHLWPDDHQRTRLPFRDEDIVAERERVLDQNLALGAPRDLGGYLRWLETHRAPTVS